jgi:hypothetical protein
MKCCTADPGPSQSATIPGLQRTTIAREDARERAYGAAPRPGNDTPK